MGLSYHFTFAAPATKTVAELESFLKTVEPDARAMGFEPVLVLNAPFDTKERREFARRLTTGYRLESNKLKGVVILRAGQVWSHDPVHGDCRVIPPGVARFERVAASRLAGWRLGHCRRPILHDAAA